MKEEVAENELITETEQVYRTEYQKLKLKLDDLQNSKGWRSMVAGIIIMLLTGVGCSIYLIMNGGHDLYSFALTGVTAFILGVVTIYFEYVYIETLEKEIYEQMLECETKDMQEKVQDDVFENSIKLTYKYLDQYYLQIREQAQKGFFITVCVSIFGAILIGAGIVSMFRGNTDPTYVTCAAGVITEFIATIFFYMYNKTVTSMSKYHNKLVLSHNVSIALKVADTLPSEDKIKSKNLIISKLLKDMNSHLIKSDSEDTKK